MQQYNIYHSQLRAYKMNKLPNFLILGAAKSGTTSVSIELMLNPSIFIPKAKELHYFDSDERYALGRESYMSLFAGAPEGAIGEATPSYLSEYRRVIPRIQETLASDTKFIVILRDPVDRAWSHYNHVIRARGETRTFKEVMQIDVNRAERVESWENYFKDGLYAVQLESWFKVFPKEQFLILQFEKIAADMNDAIAEICTFLGVPFIKRNISKQHNTRSLPRSTFLRDLVTSTGAVRDLSRMLLPRRTRQFLFGKIKKYNRRPLKNHEITSVTEADESWLRALYEDDITRLETLIGVDLSSWKRPSVKSRK